MIRTDGFQTRLASSLHPLINLIMKETIKSLRETIAHHDHLYYVQGEPEIPDAVYDRMFIKLQGLEREHPEFFDPNSPTCRVGSDLVNSFNTENHLTPMLSISSVQTTEEIEAFTTGFDTICQLKYDGVGVNLIYKDGKLYKAITRGDGYKGTDVTANIRTITNIPLTVDTHDQIEIRGEVWCPYSELKRLQSLGENVKSPVAVAINTIKIKYSDKCAKRNLKFTAFYLTDSVAGVTHTENIAWLKSNHFDTPVTFDIQKVFRHFAHSPLRPLSFTKDIPADGVVFKHDNLAVCEAEANNYRSINWAISYKFDKEIYQTTVAGIGGKVGANGRITHFVYINPLTINNETITKIQIPPSLVHSFIPSFHHSVPIRRIGTRVAQLVPSSIRAVVPSSLTCPQCSSLLISKYNQYYCSANCQNHDAPTNGETYLHVFETTADSLSIDPGLYQAIANTHGARLFRADIRSNKYKLYYNQPRQLADIGFAIGNFHAQPIV